MGQLVFQATLGGQVNLVGPNTASTFNLNVPAVSATLATTDANTFTAAQTISSGNLVFSGTGQKVTGDYSNATVSSRQAFQSSTTNGSTGIYALPNGTSTAASWQATNAADPTNASKILIATNGSTDVQLVSGINGTGTYLPLTFYTSGAEKMRLDTSGNLGLGVTPSAWDSTYRAFQFGRGSAIWSSPTGDYGVFSQNTNYSSGAYKYIQSTYATYYQQYNGQHQWFNAPSGTAGASVTFTQAMTLDASGNLGVGTTSPTWQLSLRKDSASSSAGAYPVVQINNANASGYAALYMNDSTALAGLETQRNTAHLGMYAGGAERARIDSSGNLLVGTTTADSFCRFSTQGAVGGRWGFGPSLSGSDLFRVENASATGVYLTNGGTSWTANSDERLKDIIEPITDASNKVSTLRAVIGKYKTDEEGVRRSFLIAQDVQAVLPEAVYEQEDELNTLGVQYTEVIPLLVAAIKEQQAIITQLQADVASLKA